MRTKRPHTSSTGRPYGPAVNLEAQAKIAASLNEELNEDWKDFFNTPDRRRRNLLRSLQVRRTF